MYRVVHSDIFDDVSKSVQICEALVIDFTEAEVKDLRFTDDTSLMVLLKKDGSWIENTLGIADL
jgi:hypothetical protein